MFVLPVNVLICESGVIARARTFVPHMTSPVHPGMFRNAELSEPTTFADVHVILLPMLIFTPPDMLDML